MHQLKKIAWGLAILFSLLYAPAQAQLAFHAPTQNGPSWNSWESIQNSPRLKQRKTMIFIYADWCNWCRKMEMESFTQPAVSRFMNDHFNLVRFNGEQKEEVLFKGKKYGFIKVGQRGYNEWVALLLNGNVSFPAVVFLDEQGQVVQPISGFKAPEELLLIMQYVYSNAYLHTPWAAYQRNARVSGN